MRSNHLITVAAIAILFAGSVSAQAAGSQSGHWSFTQLDRDKNGTISKDEFLHFGRVRTFNRLDTNHNGKLERYEVRHLFRGR
jgi:Ca2+-binding EF-hand superfamily protein